MYCEANLTMVPTNNEDNQFSQTGADLHIYQPSEATVSSDQVKTLMSHFSLHYSYCMKKLIVAYMYLHTVEKQKTARAGGKAGKRSCWKAYIM